MRRKYIFDGSKDELIKELDEMKKKLNKLNECVECNVCTYENDTKAKECEICGEKLIKEVIINSLKDAINKLDKEIKEIEIKEKEFITCTTCTYAGNDKSLTECEICGSKLPKAIELPKSDVEIDEILFTDDDELSVTKLSEIKEDFNDNVKKILLNKLKDFQCLFVRGDGFCSLHAVMMGYLCLNKPLLLNNKAENIDNIKSFVDFLIKHVENIKYKSNDELLLLSQLKSNTGTIISEKIFEVLCTILGVNIDVYEISTYTGTNSERKEYKGISSALKRYSKNKYKNTIIIYTNGGHYYAIVDKKFNCERLPENAKKWRNNMFKDYDPDIFKSLKLDKNLDFI